MTLLKPRYQYERLKRVLVDGRRLYSAPNGTALPSVTTILDNTKDKTHLMEWRRKVGEEQANIITKEASGIGTRMHKYLEEYIERGSWGTPGSNPFAKQAHDMAQTVGKNALVHVEEVWGSEVSLYYPEIYAYQQFDITPLDYSKYADQWWSRVEQYFKKQAEHTS